MAFKSTTQKAPIPKISHLYHLFEQFRYFLLLIFRTIIKFGRAAKRLFALLFISNWFSGVSQM